VDGNICVHVVDIDDYFPELKELTLPTIERFCDNIKADLNVVTERRFPDWPILTEKLQVYEDGKKYDYNILLDLDILVHPDCYDPFEKNIPKTYCAFKDNYHAHLQLKSDIYFERDGRDVGISGCAIFTTRYTHDLWKFPIELSKEEVCDNILFHPTVGLYGRKGVDEYVTSRNLAKYGLKYIEPYPMNEYDIMFHLGRQHIVKYDNLIDGEEEIVERAKLWYKTFWR
jgi:hypothetical protein